VNDVDLVFLEAPNTHYFFNAVPEKGFRLVEPGQKIPMEWIGLPLEIGSDVMVTARQRPERGAQSGGLLLCPVGRKEAARNSYFPRGETPIFAEFAALMDDDGKIRAEKTSLFAAEFGSLEDTGVVASRADNVLLESFGFWCREISRMRILLDAVARFEDKKPGDDLLRRRGDSVILGDIAVPFVASESRSDMLHRCIVAYINGRLREHSVRQQYLATEKGVRSILEPTTLLGAMWVQVAQSFFKDGPMERLAARSFVTGEYHPRQDMKVRQVGPNEGRLYHPADRNKFYRRKNRRIVAASEGKVVKEKRKGRTEFLVEEF